MFRDIVEAPSPTAMSSMYVGASLHRFNQLGLVGLLQSFPTAFGYLWMPREASGTINMNQHYLQ